MAGRSRYSVSDDEAGMRGSILQNKLNLHNQQELDDAETVLLADAYEYFFDLLARGRMTSDLKLLFQIHRYFLSPLYSWAGKERTVEISKDGMLFAPVRQLHDSLRAFEEDFRKYVPKASNTKPQIAHGLAVIHCELNAIHPFREGNGRTIRLFLDLHASRVGYNPIDWGKSTQENYLKACIDGMAKKYSKMEKIIYLGLRKI
jgi:cell filamentation protein